MTGTNRQKIFFWCLMKKCISYTNLCNWKNLLLLSGDILLYNCVRRVYLLVIRSHWLLSSFGAFVHGISGWNKKTTEKFTILDDSHSYNLSMIKVWERKAWDGHMIGLTTAIPSESIHDLASKRIRGRFARAWEELLTNVFYEPIHS